jgi:hypothetical protein
MNKLEKKHLLYHLYHLCHQLLLALLHCRRLLYHLYHLCHRLRLRIQIRRYHLCLLVDRDLLDFHYAPEQLARRRRLLHNVLWYRFRLSILLFLRFLLFLLFLLFL